MTIRVPVRRLPHAEDLDLPAYQSAGAAGLDLLAALPPGHVLVLEPGGRDLVPTGLVIGLPEGFEAQVRPRSGLALRHGVTVLNAPGTIDADYRGEVKVLLVNLGAEPFEIRRGTRIAQLVLARVERLAWREAEPDATPRGEGGFGSTGSAAPGARGRRTGRIVNLLPGRALLAVAAVVDVALNGRTAPVPARALAGRLGLTPRHLEPLLQALVRAGILKGTRGPRGGYEIARERRRITAADILRVAVGDDDENGGAAQAVLFAAVVEPALREAGQAFLAALDRVTLGELCARAERAGAAPAAGLDFAI